MYETSGQREKVMGERREQYRSSSSSRMTNSVPFRSLNQMKIIPNGSIWAREGGEYAKSNESKTGITLSLCAASNIIFHVDMIKQNRKEGLP
jgi:hypothetical protein